MNKITKLLAISAILLITLWQPLSAQNFSALLEKFDQIESRIDNIEKSQRATTQDLEAKIADRTEAGESSEEIELALTDLENRMNDLSANVENMAAEKSSAGSNSEVMEIALQLQDVVQEFKNTIQEKEASQTSEIKSPAALDNFKSSVDPEIKAFSSYHHDMTNGDGKSNSFDISRVYIGAKYEISKTLNARYLTDISHASGGGKFEVFTKYAYLDWNTEFHTAHIIFGLQGTQNWSQPEKAWGYRVIMHAPGEAFGNYWKGAKSWYTGHLGSWADALLDTTGGRTPSAADVDLAASLETQLADFGVGAHTNMGSSADMGLGLSLKPTKTTYANFLVRNGVGYKNAENDMFKNFQIRAGSYFLEKVVHLSAFVEIEPWGGAEKTYYNYQWDLFGSVTQKNRYTVGLDVNSKIFAGAYENVTALCYSVFGNFNLKPNVKALARYDIYNTGFNDVNMPAGEPAMKTNSNLLIFGIDYILDEHVHIVPNMQIQSFEDSEIESNKSVYIHLQYEL